MGKTQKNKGFFAIFSIKKEKKQKEIKNREKKQKIRLFFAAFRFYNSWE